MYKTPADTTLDADTPTSTAVKSAAVSASIHQHQHRHQHRMQPYQLLQYPQQQHKPSICHCSTDTNSTCVPVAATMLPNVPNYPFCSTYTAGGPIFYVPIAGSGGGDGTVPTALCPISRQQQQQQQQLPYQHHLHQLQQHQQSQLQQHHHQITTAAAGASSALLSPPHQMTAGILPPPLTSFPYVMAVGGDGGGVGVATTPTHNNGASSLSTSADLPQLQQQQHTITPLLGHQQQQQYQQQHQIHRNPHYYPTLPRPAALPFVSGIDLEPTSDAAAPYGGSKTQTGADIPSRGMSTTEAAPSRTATLVTSASGGISNGASNDSSTSGPTALRTIVPKTDTTNHFHIFVGDLSSEVDTEMLRSAFQSFGDISDCRVVRDQHTHNSKGYGFVSYRCQTEADAALQAMNGKRLGARAVRTNWASRKPPAVLRQPTSSSTTPSNAAKRPNPTASPPLTFDAVYNQTAPSNSTVYCGGTNGALAGALSESLLRDLFAPFGRIEETRLFGEKGFAFVRFATKHAAAQAIVAVHNTDLKCGRVLKCAWGRQTGDPNHLAAAYLAAASAATAMQQAHHAQHQQQVATLAALYDPTSMWLMQTVQQQQQQQRLQHSASPGQELALQIPFVSGSDSLY